MRVTPALACVLGLTALGFNGETRGADARLERLLETTRILQDELSQSRRQHDAQIEALERRIREMEQEAAGLEPPAAAARHSDDDSHHSAEALQWSLSEIVAAGGSTADGEELEALEGGTHDPRQNGSTLQALALAVRADLAEHVGATASLVSHVEPDGENIVELEQAYLDAEAPTFRLAAKAGQFYPDFGVEMTRHPDDWDFVDTPFVITRLFGGDKLRSQGVQTAWRAPLPGTSRIYAGAFNPRGETAHSFLNAPGESIGGHTLQARDVEGLDDLLYLLRWSHRARGPAGQRFGLGASALFGPNASGQSTRTQLYGLDLRWAAYTGDETSGPLFDWRTEFMWREYEAGDDNDPTRETLKDYGLFSQAVWAFRDDWNAALRAEYGDGNRNSGDDPQRGERSRLAMSLTHRLTPGVRLRLQYNHDRADYLADNSAHSLWLQLIYQAGAHGHH